MKLKSALIAFSLCVLYSNVYSFGVGVYYYVQNRQATPITLTIQGLDRPFVVPAHQNSFLKVGKTKHTAYIYKVAHYHAIQEVKNSKGETLCETQLNLGTYWDYVPLMESFSVSYISTPTDQCHMTYNRSVINMTGDTGHVYFDVY